MFDEPHFEWHNTVNVDFSCEEAEVVGGRGFPHSPAGSRFRGRPCQVASPSAQRVNTFPREAGRQESGWASHAGPHSAAQTHSDGCIQLQRAVEWGNRVPGRCFQQQLRVLEGCRFLGCRAEERTVRAMTMLPSSEGICNAHLPKPDWEEKICSTQNVVFTSHCPGGDALISCFPSSLFPILQWHLSSVCSKDTRWLRIRRMSFSQFSRPSSRDPIPNSFFRF